MTPARFNGVGRRSRERRPTPLSRRQAYNTLMQAAAMTDGDVLDGQPRTVSSLQTAPSEPEA